MSNLLKQVTHDLRRHEGCRLRRYKCSEGIWTQGIGRTKGINENSPDITQATAELWFQEDVQTAVKIARRIVYNYDSLSDVRKGVLINMALNLGEPRLKGFKKFLAAVEGSQWSTAAMEMLDSLWARQVGQRATELAARMSSDTIPLARRVK